MHFNWTQLLSFVKDGALFSEGWTAISPHVATAAVAGLLLILLSLLGRLALGKGEKAVTPASRLSLKGVLEVVIEFIVSLNDMVVGEKGRFFVPMFAGIFLYIFVNNIFGLIPGMTPATDNLNTTLAVGLFSFVLYNFYGLKEHGISYLKHFLGPIMALAPLMLVIEIISHIVRPISLGLRLQGNMMGDHTVLGVFVDMFQNMGTVVPGLQFVPVPAIFYGLGLFVCFMQAFVFTMLSMIYVSMAISHDH